MNGLTPLQVAEEILRMVDEAFPVVHVLRSGYPLCGFSLALPERWPPGHRFTSSLEPEKANCPDCKEVLEAQPKN